MEPFTIDNYIVRIYRRDGKNPQNIVGLVEQVGVEEKRAFHNLAELWTILSSERSNPPRKKEK